MARAHKTGRTGKPKAGNTDHRKLRGHVTCPHCWLKFRTDEIVWVAKHEDLRDDLVLGENKPTRFFPTRFNVAGEALDGRGMACQQHACPRCHLPIPPVFLEISPLFFSLIGVPASGKSYFLAVMTQELSRSLPQRFLLEFSHADPSGNQTLIDYVRSLFGQDNPNEMVGIDQTMMEGDVTYVQVNLEGQPVRLPRPFLFMMRTMDDHPSKGLDKVDAARIICMYDNAGEHFLPGMDRTLAPGMQHVARASVLMFLYDPTKDVQFRKQCQECSSDPQLALPISAHPQATILTETALRVQQYAGLAPAQKLDQPLLVLVSKSDIWQELIDEDIVTEPYLSSETVPGKVCRVDIARIENTNRKLRELMLDVAPEFVAAAEGSFKHVCYIPVSALGRSPERQEGTDSLLVRAKDIKPSWVTVPILYSFTKWATGILFGGPPA